MSHLIDRIIGKEITELVSSFKSCKSTNDAFVLESKFGSLTLDLQRYGKLSCCKLKIRRQSGNGVVSIQSKIHAISSKVGQYIVLDLNDVSNLEIVRPMSSTGNVELLEVAVYTEEAVLSEVSLDVKNALKLCETASIRIVNGRAFVSDGGYIKTQGGVDYIETNPPNMYKNDGTTIKFLGSCEIVKLRVVGVVDREIPEYIKQANALNHNSSTFTLKASADETDSFVGKASPVNEETVVAHNYDVSQTINSLILGRYGELIVDSLNLQPNRQYVLNIRGQIIDGNGRFTVLVSNANLVGNAFYLTSGTLKIPFKTNDGLKQRLIINRGNSSTGRLDVSRITFEENDTVIGEVDIRNVSKIEREKPKPQPQHTTALSRKIGRAVPQNREIIAPYRPPASPRIHTNYTNISSWYKYDQNIDLKIKRLSEHFSVLPSEKYAQNNKIASNAIFGLTDINSRLWYNRIAPSLTGSGFYYDGVAFFDNVRSNSIINTYITSLDFLTSYPKIFLQEIADGRELTNSEISALGKCGHIVTPSLTDMFKIKSILPDTSVECEVLPWAFVDGKYERKQYSIYYEFNESATLELLAAWDPSYGKLYIVGSTLDLPHFAEHLSQYIKYEDLVKYIVEANNLIYISENFNHKSGLIDLALNAKVNLISNNHNYILAGETIRNTRGLIPAASDVKRALGNLGRTYQFSFDTTTYNLRVTESLKIIGGV